MEREIKFRGKSASGRWLYGSLLSMNSGLDIQINSNGRFTSVLANTVGQYTCLKDKNGVEIYEGDIIRQDFEEYTGTVGYVYFENGAFKITNLYDNDGYNELSAWAEHTVNRKQRIEVIGNIYDNPNLVEG